MILISFQSFMTFHDFSGKFYFSSFSRPCGNSDLKIRQMTLKNNRAPFLCYFKLCASLRSHMLRSGIAQFGSKLTIFLHYDDRALNGNPGLQYPPFMVQCTHLITTGGTPHLYNRGSSMQVNSLHSGANNI